MDSHAADGIALDAISATGVHELESTSAGPEQRCGPPGCPGRSAQVSGTVKVFAGMVSPPETTVVGRV